jgi:hypothetical protein
MSLHLTCNMVSTIDDGKKVSWRALRLAQCRLERGDLIYLFEIASSPSISLRVSRNCRSQILRGQDFHNFIIRFIFISPFHSEKDLNAISKIVLRK